MLIHILNRLGAVCSEDVHDRFVTKKAQLQQGRHVWDELPSELFTLATVDNFDMLQSHTAVYCGDQQRSYHGTTIRSFSQIQQCILFNQIYPPPAPPPPPPPSPMQTSASTETLPQRSLHLPKLQPPLQYRTPKQLHVC